MPVQTRSMAKKEEAKPQVATAAAKKNATVSVPVATPVAKEDSVAPPPVDVAAHNEAVATMKRLLASFAAALSRDERASRICPVMEYLLTPGGEFLMRDDKFRITVDKKIQQLLCESPSIKLAILMCRVYEKYFL